MFKWALIIGLIVVGYWYYTGPYQTRSLSPEQQAQENARLMNRCMKEEATMMAGASLAGVMPEGGDVQALCADKLRLELRDGQWLRLEE